MDWVSRLTDAPFANILFLAGLAFLAIGVIGRVAGKIEPDRLGRIISGALGVILIVLGFFLRNSADQEKEEKNNNGVTVSGSPQPSPKVANAQQAPPSRPPAHDSKPTPRASRSRTPASRPSACSEEGRVVSPSSSETTRIGITNTGDVVLRLFWIGYDGKRVQYGPLAPGQRVVQSTYVGHFWLLGGPNGDCRALVTAQTGLMEFEVR